MNRVTLNDTLLDAVDKIAEGNAGAATVIGQLLTLENGFISLLHLDDAGIYGASLWVCYKDLCQEDIQKLNTKIVDRTLKDEWAKVKGKYVEQGAIKPY